MELILKTTDLMLMECRYTVVFSIFSYALKVDQLSMVYFKQREVLYRIISRNCSLDDFHENMMKNVIICLSSIMLKINTCNISLNQQDSSMKVEALLIEDYQTVERIMRSQGDIALDFLHICVLLMSNLLGHLKTDYYSQYKYDFVTNYITTGLSSGQNVPLLRISLEAYVYLLPYLPKIPITPTNIMNGIINIFSNEPNMKIEDQMDYIQQIFSLFQGFLSEVHYFFDQVFRILEKLYSQIHQVILKRNPFQLLTHRKTVINLSDFSTILVHSLMERNGQPKYQSVSGELINNLNAMNFQILVQFQNVFFDQHHKIAIYILAAATDY